MGLLTPLYALAAIAIAGPIIFHLIRRQPQGQQQFSSLMFLQPSPPRLTRRSRLDHWFLLLLRALAIALIAIAFARPYLRQEALLNVDMDERTVVVMVDTSASMQREDVWNQARQQIDQLLDSLSATDRVALYTIDETLHEIVPLENEQSMDATASQEAVRSAAQKLEPTWLKTELALGLTGAADLLNGALISGKVQAGTVCEIVLISDLHTQCGLESLQGYPWPESIGLDVRRILPSVPGNARPSLMIPSEDSSDEATRVRIENNETSDGQTFELSWANAGGTIANASTRVQVPAGQVRVVPMPPRPASSDRVTLSGDSWDGDNDVFVINFKPADQRIAFVGEHGEEPENDVGYFLKKAPLSTALVRRQVIDAPPGELAAALAEEDLLCVVLDPTSAQWSGREEVLREFAQRGGSVLTCLSRPGDNASLANQLQSLLAYPGIAVSEADNEDYALLGWVDYRSPVFAPFADPRFNDFSKIRFWNHRVIDLPQGDDANSTRVSVIARFDDESPLLIHQTVGTGHIWVLATGWQPAASGLALSSKFVPILLGILDPAGKTRRSHASFAVGDPIPVDSPDVQVTNPMGVRVDDSLLKVDANHVRLLEPGLFTLQSDDGMPQQVAVQVPQPEGQLAPLDGDVFEQYGVGIGKLASDADRREAARQLQVEELERKQRIWQWLIALALGVLALETLLAGWAARRGATQLASA